MELAWNWAAIIDHKNVQKFDQAMKILNHSSMYFLENDSGYLRGIILFQVPIPALVSAQCAHICLVLYLQHRSVIVSHYFEIHSCLGYQTYFRLMYFKIL